MLPPVGCGQVRLLPPEPSSIIECPGRGLNRVQSRRPTQECHGPSGETAGGGERVCVCGGGGDVWSYG